MNSQSFIHAAYAFVKEFSPIFNKKYLSKIQPSKNYSTFNSNNILTKNYVFGNKDHIALNHSLLRVTLPDTNLNAIETHSSSLVTPEKLSDGYIFTDLLSDVPSFELSIQNLQSQTNKWLIRLQNLKRFVNKVEEYFEKVLQKGIQTSDIDLIDIAKRYSIKEIEKIFEVIIAVLLQSPQCKEENIQKIMSLSEQHQQTFMKIIQNYMSNRMISVEEMKKNKMMQNMQILQSQNIALQEDIEESRKYIEQLCEKILLYESHMQQMQKQVKKKIVKYSNASQDKSIQESILRQAFQENEHKLIQSLKEKILQLTRQHELELTDLSTEISNLKVKLKQCDTFQEIIIFYREKYQECLNQVNSLTVKNLKNVEIEMEKQDYKAQLYQLEDKIKGYEHVLEKIKIKNWQLEENVIEYRILLQKNNVRTKRNEKKQLKQKCEEEISKENNQKQMKNQYLQNNSSTYQIPIQKQSSQIKDQNLNEISVVKLKNHENQNQRFNQLFREYQKVQKKIQNYKLIQMEKKQLECILLSSNKQHQEQLNMMVSALYETHRSFSSQVKDIISSQ